MLKMERGEYIKRYGFQGLIVPATDQVFYISPFFQVVGMIWANGSYEPTTPKKRGRHNALPRFFMGHKFLLNDPCPEANHLHGQITFRGKSHY